MSHKNTIMPTSTQEPPPPKFLTADEDQGPPGLTVDQQLEAMLSRWDCILQFDAKHWTRNSEPNSALRYAILHQYVIGGFSGPTGVSFLVDVFTPAVATDAKTKKLIPVRRHAIKTSPTGERCPVAFTIPAVQFIAQYHPEESWMKAGEWRDTLDFLAPTIKLETELQAREAEDGRIRDTEAQEARLARENPTKHLAAGISAGIAQALRELGIERKEGAL